MNPGSFLIAKTPAARLGSTIWSAAAIVDFLTASRPLPVLLLGSFAVSLMYVSSVLSFSFILGISDVWNNARGIVDGSWADISTALSGYYAFVRDSWHFPLFYVAKLGAPNGVNVIYTDSIPILCIFGRVWYELTGSIVNPYGVWLCVCLAGAAVCDTWLVSCLGGRSIAAAATATLGGLCMPALLFRWGHMSLMAQFEIELALIFFVQQGRSRQPAFFSFWPSLLIVLALWTQVYLFATVFALVSAGLAQAVLEGRLRLARGAAVFLGWIVVAIVTVRLSGHLQTANLSAGGGFQIYSMNALAPIFPQQGGLALTRAVPFADATGGQYEGFNYLGAGTLLLAAAAMWSNRRAVRAALNGRACLLLVLIGLTGLALSNEIFVGPWRVATVPLPFAVLVICSLLRSTGRFFWPAGYWITAASIASAGHRGRAGGAVLLLAACLQWWDTGPLRSALARSALQPAPLHLDQARWRGAISRHEFVRLMPAFACLPGARSWSKEVALQLQLLAARERVTTNTVYAARYVPDCPDTAVPTALGPRELRIYFSEFHEADRPAGSFERQFCRSSAKLTICSRVLNAAELQSLSDSIAPN